MAVARRLLGARAVGPPEGARQAVDAGATYLGVGPAYYLQDYEQALLMPRAAPDLSQPEPEPIDSNVVGRVFANNEIVDVSTVAGVRLYYSCWTLTRLRACF